MPLTDLVTVIPPDAEEEPEDIFAFAAGLIFTDDSRNFHGDDRSLIVYKSTKFGNIELRTADPPQEDDRQRFAYYLWNAGISMAERLSNAADANWSMRSQRVLELGAGVGLGGILAVLAGAREVVITDYPTDIVLDNIRQNAKRAIPPPLAQQYRVDGYAWGDVESDFATDNAHSFDCIIAADCYWMAHQHDNLVTSMLHMLGRSPEARVLAIAGFHTGRAILANFFEVAISRGLKVEDIFEEDVQGVTRQWAPERDGGREDVTGRKRWLVIAVLKRRQP